MVNGCFTVAEMAALGLGLKKDTFTKRMEKGPHLLAPTGSDLTRYKKGTIFAGFHYGKLLLIQTSTSSPYMVNLDSQVFLFG